MADTFTNDLRLRLQESGANSGQWGTLLNTTISNIASAFSLGSEAIPDASTHTITLADGTADEARSMYLKCTGGGQACTVTLAPNTISKVWIISNETSFTLTFSQGSGANVAVAAGAVKMIVTDGAGSGAAVTDALSGLDASLSGLTVDTTTLVVDSTNNRVRQNDGTTQHRITATGGVIFNDGGIDQDFRVESDTNTHALFVEGSSGNVGIGSTSPNTTLTLSDGTDEFDFGVTTNQLMIKSVTSDGADDQRILIDAGNGGQSSTRGAFIALSGNEASAEAGKVIYQTGNVTGSAHVFRISGGSEAARIDSSGNLLVGTTDTGAGVGNTNTGLSLLGNGFAAISRTGTSGQPTLVVNKNTNDGELVGLYKSGSQKGAIGIASNSTYIGGSGNGAIYFNGIVDVRPWNKSTQANLDNQMDLGSSSSRWDDVFSTGGISTSDRNEKQDIEELTDAEKRVAVACKGLIRKFRWKSSVEDKGDDARIHVGIISQDLRDAFIAEGLDPARYSMWCSDTWTDKTSGEEVTRMSVRYNELLAFIISAI